jgi:hypothetical protein
VGTSVTTLPRPTDEVLVRRNKHPITHQSTDLNINPSCIMVVFCMIYSLYTSWCFPFATLVPRSRECLRRVSGLDLVHQPPTKHPNNNSEQSAMTPVETNNTTPDRGLDLAWTTHSWRQRHGATKWLCA